MSPVKRLGGFLEVLRLDQKVGSAQRRIHSADVVGTFFACSLGDLGIISRR